jgi:murein DD-endopeptidase MepM/ murein hydrolase activator NlpD
MVRIVLFKRAAAMAAIAFVSSALAGCVADTPRTQLTWYPESDARPVRVARRETPPPPKRLRPKPVETVALDCPVPKAKPNATPGWYPNSTPSSTPATYTAPADGASFAWPLNGAIVADYGATVSGGSNAGINIAAPAGTPIRAAAAGQISYAGSELRGYGNLVLIKHDDGYVTAYAHAERIVVNRGDYVQKGQIIAYEGQTGDVTSPQLHFEIRKGVTPLNPRTLLVPMRSS